MSTVKAYQNLLNHAQKLILCGVSVCMSVCVCVCVCVCLCVCVSSPKAINN